jgi:hypothetical protein
MSRCLYQLGEDSYHLKLPPQAIATSPEPAGHAHSVLATTSPTQRGRPRERAPHMHTLTLLTASLKRGISMMNHRPALCVANTSESFLGNRPPRVPIMHEVNAAQGRNAETRASYRGETHPNSPETGVAWTRIPDSTTHAKLSSRDQASAAPAFSRRPLGLHFRRLVCRVAALRWYSRRAVKYIRSPFCKAYLCAIAVRLHSFVDPLHMVYTCDRR